MKIFINPGHHPEFDPGAVNERLGLTEADVARRIADRVASYINDCGHQTRVFQADGTRRIANAANEFRADLFVSIHCPSDDGRARGTEAFYHCGSTDGRRLAECINRQIATSIDGIINRGVSDEDFKALASLNMPAALIAAAFIDNDDDARLLVDKQDDFARAIARGITDFLN